MIYTFYSTLHLKIQVSAMNFNDTSPDNIKKIQILWSKSLNLINQRRDRSDTEILKNNRVQAHQTLKDPELWKYIWNNNWSYPVEEATLKSIASWDRDDLIVPFAKHLLWNIEQNKTLNPVMKPIRMDVLLRSLFSGYRAKRSAKALELFLRSDPECAAEQFINSRFAVLMEMAGHQTAMDLISPTISPENQWTLMCALFNDGAQWKNVIRNAKKMKKVGWDLNNIPAKNNIVGHILRTNRVFYANKEECQDLIKIGVRPINLQVPCSVEFMQAFAQFENEAISGQINEVSKNKTTRTKKM